MVDCRSRRRPNVIRDADDALRTYLKALYRREIIVGTLLGDRLQGPIIYIVQPQFLVLVERPVVILDGQIRVRRRLARLGDGRERRGVPPGPDKRVREGILPVHKSKSESGARRDKLYALHPT